MNESQTVWGRTVLAFASVRMRATITSTLVVALALVVAGWAMVQVQRHNLAGNIETAVLLRVDDIESLLAQDRLPPTLTTGDTAVALVQVFDGNGNLIAASPNATGLAQAMDGPPPAVGETRVADVDGLPIDDERFRVVVRTVATPNGPATVYVAGSLEPVGDSIESLTQILLVGIPLLAALVAVATWLVVGRALAPVDAIRAEVDSITGRELDRRVPEPAARDEIGRLARTMNAMLGRLERSHERQERFVADASHELRTPFASIRTQLEVELDSGGDWPGTARGVIGEIDEMHRMVEDLLFLARSDGEHQIRRADLVDIDDLVLREAQRVGSRIAVDLSAVSAGQVNGEAATLRRAIRNVLGNAIEHAERGVVIRLSERDGLVTLEIADDGAGIPEAERDRVFERFSRLDDSRTRERGGAGLGLAITRTIVEAHGGRIAIEANAPRGTVVRVVLPAGAEGINP